MKNNKIRYVGHYQINLSHCLGEGAFGKVYSGKDRNRQEDA